VNTNSRAEEDNDECSTPRVHFIFLLACCDYRRWMMGQEKTGFPCLSLHILRCSCDLAVTPIPKILISFSFVAGKPRTPPPSHTHETIAMHFEITRRG
jgi:hypothetical protein